MTDFNGCANYKGTYTGVIYYNNNYYAPFYATDVDGMVNTDRIVFKPINSEGDLIDKPNFECSFKKFMQLVKEYEV